VFLIAPATTIITVGPVAIVAVGPVTITIVAIGPVIGSVTVAVIPTSIDATYTPCCDSTIPAGPSFASAAFWGR
jgi:hypothetical protein